MSNHGDYCRTCGKDEYMSPKKNGCNCHKNKNISYRESVSRKQLTKKESPKILIKVPDEKEFEQLKVNADKYAKGNMSAWLRAAGLNYVPRKIRSV